MKRVGATSALGLPRYSGHLSSALRGRRIHLTPSIAEMPIRMSAVGCAVRHVPISLLSSRALIALGCLCGGLIFGRAILDMRSENPAEQIRATPGVAGLEELPS